MTFTELARDILRDLIAKSGVREFDDPTFRTTLAEAALDLAAQIYAEPPEEIMATSKLLGITQDGTPAQISFYKASGFSPSTDLRFSGNTAVEIDLTSLANGSCRQSAKFTFGAARAPYYSWRAVIEMAATPTAGNTILLYMGWSEDATAANNNPANLTGSDAAYTGYSSNADAALKHLDLVGVLTVTTQATATVQVLHGGLFKPLASRGILVVRNGAGSAFHSGVTKVHLVADPIFIQGQAT